MRLFFRLLRDYFPNERKYRGKKRKPFPYDGLDQAALERAIQREEKVMFLLRQPYLNDEESKHLVDRGRKYESMLFYTNARAAYILDKKPHYRIEDHLNHLRHGDAWDV